MEDKKNSTIKKGAKFNATIQKYKVEKGKWISETIDGVTIVKDIEERVSEQRKREADAPEHDNPER